MIISIKVNPFDVQQLQEGVIDENDELKNAFILEPHAGTLFENCHKSLIFGERIEVRLFLVFCRKALKNLRSKKRVIRF